MANKQDTKQNDKHKKNNSKKQKPKTPKTPLKTQWDRQRTVEEITDIVNSVAEAPDEEKAQLLWDHATKPTDRILVKLCRSANGSPHVRVRISPDTATTVGNEFKASLGDRLLCLKDSGSNNSLISEGAFLALTDRDLYIKTPTNTVLTTAITGEKSKKCYTIDAVLTFEETTGKSLSIRHKIYVVPDLSDDFILGDDIFKANLQADMQSYLLMSDGIKSESELDQMTGLELKEHCVRLPVHYVESKKLEVNVRLTQTVTLEPNIPLVIESCLEGSSNAADLWDNQAIEISPTPTYMSPSVTTVQPGWQPCIKGRPLELSMTHHGPSPLTIPRDTIVARASYLDSESGMQTRKFDLAQSDVEQHFTPTSETNDTNRDSWYNPPKAALLQRLRHMMDREGVTDPLERQRMEERLLNQGYVDAPMAAEPTGEVQELGYQKEEKLDFEAEFAKVKIGSRGRPYLKEIKALLWRQRGVIQVGGKLEKTNKGIADPQFKPITKPIIQKSRPIPEQLRPEIDKIVSQLIENGIVEKAKAPPICLSNLHYTRKPSGELRLLVDLRSTNYFAQRIDYPNMTQDESVARLSTAHLVSSLDVASAYWSVGLSESAKRYFAFSTPSHGVVAWTSLPMGYSQSSYFLAQILDRVFEEVPDLIRYVDDVVVYDGQDSDVLGHLRHVENTLKALRESKFSIKTSKLEILPDILTYLGIWFSIGETRSMSIPTAKIKAYEQAARPKRPKDVKKFLASVGYFRRWVPRFTDVTYQLHLEALKPPKAPFKWTIDLEKYYMNFLKILNKHCTLLLPDPSKDFIIYSDASQIAASFIIYQKSPCGLYKIVANSSKLFSPAHRAKPIYVKELIALCGGLHTFQFFLRHAKRILAFTDAKGISVCNLVKASDDFIMRKAIFLSMFPITIFHLPGELNLASDYLSRYHGDHRADDKCRVKGLTVDQAVRLVDAVHFKPIRLTPEEIRAVVVAGPSQVGPDSKSTKAKSAKKPLELKGHGLALPTRPPRKIKLPPTQAYSRLMPRLRAQLEGEGWSQKERERAREEDAHDRSREEEKEWLREKYKQDPISAESKADAAYFKWLEKPVGPMPPVPAGESSEPIRAKLSKIEEWPAQEAHTGSDSFDLWQIMEEEDRQRHLIPFHTLPTPSKCHNHNRLTGVPIPCRVIQTRSKTRQEEPDKQSPPEKANEQELNSAPNIPVMEISPAHLPAKRGPGRPRKASLPPAETSTVADTGHHTRSRGPVVEGRAEAKPEAASPLPPPSPPPRKWGRLRQRTVVEEPRTNSPIPDHIETTLPTQDRPPESGVGDTQVPQTGTAENPRPCCKPNEEGLDCEHTLTGGTWTILASQPVFNTISKEQFKECQERDPYCQSLLEKHAKRKKSLSKPQTSHRFTMVDNIICRTNDKGKHRPVIPLALLQHKTRVAHYSIYGLHQSAYKIFKTLEDKYFTTRMEEKVRKVVEDCALCPFLDREVQRQGSHGVIPYPDKPRSFYHIDWCGGLSKTKDGNTSVLIVVDRFSLLARFYPVKSRTADETIQVLNMVQQADCTMISDLKSDQEPCLKTKEFKDYCQGLGITHRYTAASNPQSNATAELTVRNLKKSIRILSNTVSEEWDKCLHYITIGYSKMKSDTGLSPEVGHFGFEAPSAFSITEELLQKPLPALVEAQQQQVRERRAGQAAARNAAAEAKRDYRKSFNPGDLVMHAENPIKSNSAMKLRNSGPFRINTTQEPDSYSLWCTDLRSGTQRKFPISSLSHHKAEFPEYAGGRTDPG